ncbi:MAG: hypothetical protein ACLRZH_15755 [Ruthenibacterium lactatiformans]
MEVFSSAILGPAERAMELTACGKASKTAAMAFSALPACLLPDGRLCGAEALSRWQCAFGSVPPGEFIALLERTA